MQPEHKERTATPHGKNLPPLGGFDAPRRPRPKKKDYVLYVLMLSSFVALGAGLFLAVSLGVGAL